MSFLDKFKGKTHMITKKDINGILGNSNNHYNTQNNKNKNQSFVGLSSQNKNIKKQQKVNKHSQEQRQQLQKLKKVNPYLMANPFYLDEQQRQKDIMKKKQRELKERIERQRKKNMLLESKMLQSSKSRKNNYNNSKQWRPLGGLGPNIGGQQWTYKKQMHDKMMKFAQQIKQININRLKNKKQMSYSTLKVQKQKDARSKAIEYSLHVVRPRLAIGQRKNISVSDHYYMKQIQQLSQLQLLEEKHKKYSKMIERF